MVLDGITPAAREALEDAPLVIARFPFRIGGDGGSDRLFVNNDLVLRPSETSHVARNHCMLINVSGRCFLVDRGSRMGTFVNGVRVGEPVAVPGGAERGPAGACRGGDAERVPLPCDRQRSRYFPVLKRLRRRRGTAGLPT